MPDAAGETRRDRNTKFGVESPDIDVPPEGEHLWEWFWQVSRRRRTGPEAISYTEVGEWQRLTDTAVLPEELDLLMLMDDAFLAEVRKEQREAEERARENMRGPR